MALSQIAPNPALNRYSEVRGFEPGIRLYHQPHSRTPVAFEGRMVKSPSHLIAYMVRDDDTLIERVLHHRVGIARQLEELT